MAASAEGGGAGVNAYANLGMLKAEIGGNIGDTDDDALLRILARTSRGIDEACGRHFYSLSATRYYDGGGARCLWLPDDLISITTLRADDNRDGTHELTLVADTDYWLWPDNPQPNSPYLRLDLVDYGSPQLYRWPLGRRSVQIVGKFGYSEETEACGTLGAEIASTSATAVTMTAGHGLTGGETILVGSEQMYVSAVEVNTLTVVRGVNGTTAATHSNGATVTRRRYHRNIEQACVLEAARTWRESQTGYSGQAVPNQFGGFSTSSSYPKIRDLLAPLRHPAVMVA